MVTKTKSKPSPTELIILKSLWKQAPFSAREVHNNVEKQLKWSYSSTRKTLERMLDKKYIRSEDSHGIKVFYPVISKVKTLASFVADFTQRILEVDTPLPVTMFADSKLLNKTELEELETLLEKFESNDD